MKDQRTVAKVIVITATLLILTCTIPLVFITFPFWMGSGATDICDKFEAQKVIFLSLLLKYPLPILVAAWALYALRLYKLAQVVGIISLAPFLIVILLVLYEFVSPTSLVRSDLFSDLCLQMTPAYFRLVF